MVELLDFREGHVDHRDRVGALVAGIEHGRQAVQGLGAKHHIDIGRTLAQRLAFLAGHAAADADHQVRVLFLELLPAAKLVKDLFLRLLADGAGVEQDDVGVTLVVGHFQFVRIAEQIRHAGRVILVHLAAVGLDEEFLRHNNRPRPQGSTARPSPKLGMKIGQVAQIGQPDQ